MNGGSNTLATLQEVVRRFPDRRLLATGLACLAANTVMGVVAAHLLRLLVDAAIAGAIPTFVKLMLLDVAMHAAMAAISWVDMRYLGKYAETGVARLREEAVGHLARASVSELEKVQSGDLISRLTNDLRWVRMFMGTNFSILVYTPLETALVFAYLCSVSWKLTLVALAATPVLVYIGRVFSPEMYRLGLEIQERLGSATSIVKDVLSGIKVARAFNLAEAFDQKHGAIVDQAVAKTRALEGRRVLLEGTTGFMSIVPYMLLYGLGGYWAIRGEISPGGLLAFVTLSGRLTVPLSLLPALIGRARVDMAAAGRIFEILKLGPERTGGQVSRRVEGPVVVEVRDLSFSYPGREETVLRDVTFQVRQGEKVAVVGPSGSGKSTLAKLLLGLYEGYSGSLDVLGAPVKDWDLTDLRSSIAFVAQDTFLFPGSIKDNIRCGRLDAGDDDVVRAAKAAKVDDFASPLPRGYDTEVGELAGRFSGGEKQRMAVARAMLRDAALLILDEPTSSLDAESEAVVEDALRGLTAGRTCIVIAHRLSTIRDADRILVLDGGSIVESGTHDELMDRNGLYAKLYTNEASDSGQVRAGEQAGFSEQTRAGKQSRTS